MYRFVLSPGWLGRLAAALAAATVMSLLGVWQLNRYEERSEINARIDAADPDRPADLAAVLTAPEPDEPVGPPMPASASWSMVRVTGRFDHANEILVRGRTVQGQVGVEVVTPLVLDDGSALLVDRGWIPPAPTGMGADPGPPPAPEGVVVVVGRVRAGEPGGTAVGRQEGRLHTRRVDIARLSAALPYPLYDAYLLQEAPASPGLTPIPPRRENAWLNAGYAAQWWIFAGLVLAGFAWLVRREARRTAPAPARGPTAKR